MGFPFFDDEIRIKFAKFTWKLKSRQYDRKQYFWKTLDLNQISDGKQFYCFDRWLKLDLIKI